MPDSQKVIISCAITGGMTVPGQSSAIPIMKLGMATRRPEQVMEIIYDAQAALMEQACQSRGPAEVIPLFARARERRLAQAATV